MGFSLAAPTCLLPPVAPVDLLATSLLIEADSFLSLYKYFVVLP